jgi:hypothetical protein
MTEQYLIEKLKDELSEDLSRYDYEFDAWFTAALDCPSRGSERIQGEIFELVGEVRYEEIMGDIIVPYMRSLEAKA